jgi:excisionase family DNA binding protein
MAEALLPVATVAKLWGVSKNYVYDRISDGSLRSVNLPSGRAKTRIPESALADFINANTRSAA